MSGTDGATATAARYGFVIDNRRCIGCHACSVACKAEHGDPLGIQKTWVLTVDRGRFPGTRSFHVFRCNHCAEPPCVEICPTASLEQRPDGIVDFDPGRCVGCKACQQACPYDAIAIHPESGTATKCNYCAHRVDSGREPACVVVCPTQAIVAGDLSDPTSAPAHLLGSEPTSVRKPEKGTRPQLAYVRGERSALEPSASTRSVTTIAGCRPRDALDELPTPQTPPAPDGPPDGDGAPPAWRSYDIRQRHAASWGWKVSAYLFTKSVAAGAFLVPVLAVNLVPGARTPLVELLPGAAWSSIVALAITGVLLVADLKRPERFLWVLLRPQWRSWLVRGAYIIAAYGALLALWVVSGPDPGGAPFRVLSALGLPLAAATAAYSGWLFGQAKGRDLWQSPLAPLHLLVQAGLAGVAFWCLIAPTHADLSLRPALVVLLLVDLALVSVEAWGRHATEDAARAAHILRDGAAFAGGAVAAGHLLPLLLAAVGSEGALAVAGLLSLAGLAVYEHLWVAAPQRIPLA